MDDVGIFRTTIEVQNLDMRGSRRALPETLVDTGSEYTWVPRRVLEDLGIRAQRTQAFEVADGRRVERDIGYALVRAGGYVFAPSHHVHRFSCLGACSAFVHSDGTFDVHYVDQAGNEIPPEQALKHNGAMTTQAKK